MGFALLTKFVKITSFKNVELHSEYDTEHICNLQLCSKRLATLYKRLATLSLAVVVLLGVVAAVNVATRREVEGRNVGRGSQGTGRHGPKGRYDWTSSLLKKLFQASF